MKNRTTSISASLPFLWLTYIILASNSNLWKLPYLDSKFQLSEILFLFLFPLSIPLLKKIKYTPIDFLFLGYASLFIINVFFHPELNVLLEVSGTLYLVGMYFLLSRFLAQVPQIDTYLTKAFLGLLAFACISATIGYLLYVFGVSTRYVIDYKNYPYFGDVVRWRGFSASPNMLSSIICVSIFFIQSSTIKPLQKWLLTLLALGIAALTFSKELAAFFALLLFMLVIPKLFKTLPLKITIPYFSLLALVMVALTFFIYVPKQLEANLNYDNKEVIAHEPILSTAQLDVIPTSYYYLFQSAKTFAAQHPIAGIGVGNFQFELKKLKEQGGYPSNIPIYETHDFYWGQIAEIGFTYFIFLFFLAWGYLHLIKNKAGVFNERYHLFFVISIIFILIESAIINTQHYRHYWIFFAIINNFYLRYLYK